MAFQNFYLFWRFHDILVNYYFNRNLYFKSGFLSVSSAKHFKNRIHNVIRHISKNLSNQYLNSVLRAFSSFQYLAAKQISEFLYSFVYLMLLLWRKRITVMHLRWKDSKAWKGCIWDVERYSFTKLFACCRQKFKHKCSLNFLFNGCRDILMQLFYLWKACFAMQHWFIEFLEMLCSYLQTSLEMNDITGVQKFSLYYAQHLP